jgi:hypothetical protein
VLLGDVGKAPAERRDPQLRALELELIAGDERVAHPRHELEREPVGCPVA